MKGEVNGASNGQDKGANKGKPQTNDDYFQGGNSGLNVKTGNAGTPEKAADLGRKGANKGGM